MTELLSKNGMLSAEEFHDFLSSHKNIKILDATFMVQAGHVSPYQAFLKKHIPGAQFFDIDAVADQAAPLPHTLPSADYFQSCASALGISSGDHVVVYDQSGAYMASSRAWWMFRTFGHDQVYVLEGGLTAWEAKGYPVEHGPVQSPPPGLFKANFRRDLMTTKDDLLANLETNAATVIDARPYPRFSGQIAEPRLSMRTGHIPGSHNLSFGHLIDPASGVITQDIAIQKLKELNVPSDGKVIVSCGSGVTACTVALALFKANGRDVAIYDGSWSEWGDEAANTPIENFA